MLANYRPVINNAYTTRGVTNFSSTSREPNLVPSAHAGLADLASGRARALRRRAARSRDKTRYRGVGNGSRWATDRAFSEQVSFPFENRPGSGFCVLPKN